MRAEFQNVMLSWLRKLSQWPIVVSSGNFQLRPMRSYDLITVGNWFKDLEILRYAFGTEAEELSLRETAQRYQAEMDGQRQYIFTLETPAQKPFGFVRFNMNRSSSHQKVARIGILIGDKSYWGKGWGTEAVATFIQFLFTQKSADRIELDTAHFNHRAQRCFEKCGFQRSRPPENYQALSNDPTVKVWMELTRQRWQDEIKDSL